LLCFEYISEKNHDFFKKIMIWAGVFNTLRVVLQDPSKNE
jgi:hypothetical protein